MMMLDRREFLAGLSAFSIAPRVFGADSAETYPVSLQSVTYASHGRKDLALDL